MILALDSSAVIDLMRGRDAVRRCFAQARTERRELRLSTIALGELAAGAYRTADVRAGLSEIADLLVFLQLAPLDAEDGYAFGRIRASLTKRGKPVEAADLLIAAQALRRGWTVVTSDVSHFGRVEGLSIVDWRVSDEPLTPGQIAERLDPPRQGLR